MSALEQLQQRRASQLDQLASEIEPLAQSLAHLADDVRQAIEEQQTSQRQQITEWTKTARSVQENSEHLVQQLQPLDHALRHLTLKISAIALLIGILSAAVTSGLLHWLPQWSETAQRQQNLGEQIETRWQTLDETQRAELKKLMGWQ